jgi:O-antigen/teichoic acid export membrane protein
MHNIFNRKFIELIKNFSYTISSNLISLIISTVVILIIPKLIGVEEYGYWQLYLFYTFYGGLLNFGWNDGIYLRYGGKDYKEIDKRLFFSQFYMLVILQLFIVIAALIIFGINFSNNRVFIFQMTALSLFIVNVRSIPLFTLQCTNKIKEYAQITMIDRILYCSLAIILIFIGVRNYKLLIAADLIGKFIGLIYAMYCCRDMVFRRISTFYFSFREAKENISVGMKLMFANIASMLIIGVVRFGIEHSWNISTFGKVSLSLNISNLMMTFINAVGIIMFPILRRTDVKKLSSIYVTMRELLMVILIGVLIIYYPLKVILSAWLPKYTDSLRYMALIFPMCMFEGKVSLLVNTYLQTLRKEKLILKINLIALALSVAITFITTIIFKNLNLAIISIVILMAFRCVLAEMFLSRILLISLKKDIFMELIITLIFILSAWYINSWLVVLLYAIVYIMYLFIKQKDINSTIKNIQILVKA